MCRLAFFRFEQSFILSSQIILLFAAFITLLGMFRDKTLLISAWIALLVFSLSLIESSNDFNTILGSVLIFAGAVFLSSRAKNETFVYKLLSCGLSFMIFSLLAVFRQV